MHYRVALLLIMTMASARPLAACAPAPHAGEAIDVVEESAVIVWDPATTTQHFIRRATFRGNARDFGFLVPTPTAPTLAAVDDGIFDTLQAKTEPPVIERTRREIRWMLLLATYRLANRGEAMTGAPVNVLQTAKVAGYEAAVLDATDAGALREWLQTHGYATTPDLEQWLDVYIRQRWKITAFKIDKTQAETDAQTQAVKMSFTTDRPFFPIASRYRNERQQHRPRSSRFLPRAGTRVRHHRRRFLAGILRWSDVSTNTACATREIDGVAIPARLTRSSKSARAPGPTTSSSRKPRFRALSFRRRVFGRTSRSS